jgi:hypothetical protein
MSTALFAYTVEDQWVRLTDWVSTPEADAMWDAVSEYPRDYYVTVSVWDPKNLEYRQVQVKFYALRDLTEQWAREIFQQQSRVQVWSARAYVSDTAAAKAYNRSIGNEYHGQEGGWIYRTATGTRICQGWWKILGAKRLLREGGKSRYLVTTVSLREVKERVA